MLEGISYIVKKNSIVNNKCMQSYNDKKPRKFVVYLDANNLYGWAMSQYLPYSGSEWLNQKELGVFDVNLNGENSSDGYILEVRLAYPDELHELHNDYPLATEKLKISYNTLL